jgi:6-phosphogluconolactonase
MKFHIFKDKEELSESLAWWICDQIKETLANQQFFTWVLSGGETPKLLFAQLASEKFRDAIDWQRVQLFWGDERVVPSDDDRNNAGVARRLFVDQTGIPSKQVHVMRTDIEPVFAAKEYDELLHQFFGSTLFSFDLVLLGIGDDGHTLSLFPGSAIINTDDDVWVSAVYNESQQMYRITLLPKIVNPASRIAFMVEGDKKSAVVKKVIEGKYQPHELPAQLIQPLNGELLWFLDEAAAKELKAFKQQ